MISEVTPDPVRQQALALLTTELIAKGHSRESAQNMAIAIIFQTDLDLSNAQLARLLAWLKQEHGDIYPAALDLVAKTREEFEKRIQQS